MGLGLILGFALKGALGLKIWFLSSSILLLSLGISMWPTSWTLDHFTSHPPSGPRSNLRPTSNVKSKPLTPLMLFVISTDNLALALLVSSQHSSRAYCGFDCSNLIWLKFENSALIAFLSCYHYPLSDHPPPLPAKKIWNSPLSVSGQN